ncbi:MAG TPA: LysR family transcriptional regulator [Alphaproteobacteria bacterium]|jgi:DNA-binding transcriptional LysR family regulator
MIDLARTFLEVVAAGSFVGAAERLHITQSTVSARIRTLETQLGYKLFARNKAGAVLTPGGQKFQRHAATLVRAWEAARQDVAVPRDHRAILRMGGEAGLWNRLLFRWVPWMRSHAPDIALRCELGQADALIGALVEGVLDIAVMYTPQSRPGLRVDLLTEDELVLVEGDGPPGGTVPRDHIHVDWGQEFQRHYRMRFPDAPPPPLAIGLGTLGFDYLVQHGGTGYFPRRLAQPLIDSGRIRAVADAPAFSLPIYLVHSADADPTVIGPALTGLRAIVAD